MCNKKPETEVVAVSGATARPEFSDDPKILDELVKSHPDEVDLLFMVGTNEATSPETLRKIVELIYEEWRDVYGWADQYR